MYLSRARLFVMLNALRTIERRLHALFLQGQMSGFPEERAVDSKN